MSANTECLLPCEQWYAGPQGAFVLERELRLVQKMLSPWPRRGHSLLELGCGCGGFLDFFWESGFDVTGFAPSLEHFEQARRHMHGKADFQIGALDHLPYEDNAFDYVTLMAPPDLTAHAGPPPHVVMREAVRVAAKGVLLRLWNPFSLTGLCRSWRGKSLPSYMRQSLWLPWRDACALLRALSPKGSIATGSALLGPPSTWHADSLCHNINALLLPLPLGSVVLLRLTHAPLRPLTGLPLRLKQLRMKGTRSAAVLERKRESAEEQNMADTSTL